MRHSKASQAKSLILGIMSGTSIDGVDYALCEIDSKRVVLRQHWAVAFPPALRKRLHAAARDEAKTYEVAQLHHDLGRFYARRAMEAKVRGKIDGAGLHGQTIFHNPSRAAPATLQIGEAAYLAEALQAPVVSNFRAADIAAGGQGAPLATLFHQFVFARRGKHVCVNNLGGISNVTSLDWRGEEADFDTATLDFIRGAHAPSRVAIGALADGIPLTGKSEVGEGANRGARGRARSPETVGEGAASRYARGGRCRVMAFDIGPANILIDMAMRHFTGGRMSMDKNGRWARKGETCGEIVKGWLKHPYFRLKPPKSTGRELFGEPFFKEAMAQMRSLSRFDAVATFTEFTARSLALNYALHLRARPDKIVLTGGGASNPTLVRAISRQFSGAEPPTEIVTSADLGWPVQTIEPAAFALLAWMRLNGKPGNLPETTGARRAVLLGQVTES